MTQTKVFLRVGVDQGVDPQRVRDWLMDSPPGVVWDEAPLHIQFPPDDIPRTISLESD